VAPFNGRLALSARLTTGSWTPLLPFSLFYILSARDGKGLIGFGGFPCIRESLMLDSVLTHNVVHPFPWKSIWRTKAPVKVAFFAWSAALGKILTIDNLRKRHVIVIDRCCMCKRQGESVDHLLLHCETACALWDTILSRFGLSWVMPLRVIELFECWWTGGRSNSAVVWKMVPLCLMWCLWRERNDRSFEDQERTLEELKSFFFILFSLGLLLI
jgi:hypothetical protein